jgi:hypothetical protein
MNPTLLKAVAALVPTGMLRVGSTLRFSRGKGAAAAAAIDGLALFPIGYLFGALTREVA